ncbi:MAG TPA: ATP-dependent Clp protease ATP-binding subunit ClpX, partial [Salegentibacter sp.]
KQYQKLFEMDEIEFDMTEDALDYIVEKAIEYKLGARGLRSLCEAVLTDAMFDMPESNQTKLIVNRDYAEDKLNKSTINKLKAVS